MKLHFILQSLFINIQNVSPPKDSINYTLICSSPSWPQTIFYIAGILAVGLGVYYFFARIGYEKNRDEKNRQRRMVERILDYFNQYDKHVCEILYFTFNNEDQLNFFRQKTRDTFEKITSYLELREKSINFNIDEKKIILGVHSFIDNHQLISRSRFNDLDKNSLLSCSTQYKEKLRDARILCLEKIG